MTELLKKLDFSDKEVEIYLTILKQGKITPAMISRLTKINRSTVYVVAKKLEEKGFVKQDVGSRFAYFSAVSLNELDLVIEKEEQRIRQKRRVLKNVIEELEPIVGRGNYSIPVIRFVEESELEDFLYKQMAKWNESAKNIDGVCWGFQDHSFAEKFQGWITWVWKTYRIKVKLLSNQSQIENRLKKEFEEQRTICFWDGDVDFSSSLWVAGDYLVMVITRQHPFYLIEIKDSILAHNLREVFRKLWKEKFEIHG
jgi:predicted transcriptional regulator